LPFTRVITDLTATAPDRFRDADHGRNPVSVAASSRTVVPQAQPGIRLDPDPAGVLCCPMPAITSALDSPVWDVDADWWGPSWDVVTPVGSASADKPHENAPEPGSLPVPAPAASYVAAPDPSWGHILATTVRLWVSRHHPGADSASPALAAPSSSDALPPAADPPPAPAIQASPRAHLASVLSRPAPASADPAPPPVVLVPAAADPAPATADPAPATADPAPATADPAPPGADLPLDDPLPPSADADLPSADRARRPMARRPRVAGWAAAAWGAHARLLSAAMLSAGLLAAVAGTAGLVVARTASAPAVRLAARPSPVAVPSGPTVAPVPLSAVQPTPKPVFLTIPAIGVKARIINLGLNRNGTLQVPSTTTVAGWYTGSPRPGATGSAVIAGHVDSRTGPGIFFWLKNMHRGERIYVKRADGTLAVFTVTAVQIYTKSRFPTAMVYGPVPDAELRLITCGGTFDYARGSYLSNVVVYARLSA
jgi:sortase (surface protein transpeptidase)